MSVKIRVLLADDHAVLRAGAVVNPVNVMLTPPELGFVLRDCESVAVLCSDDKFDVVAELAGGVEGVRLVLGLDREGDTGFATLFDSAPITGSLAG